MNPRCKIKNVRLKKNPDIQVIVPSSRNLAQKSLIDAAATIADHLNGTMTGHVAIGWDKEGTYSVGYGCGDGVITPTLMPSWVRDLLLRQVTENGTIQRLEQEE